MSTDSNTITIVPAPPIDSLKELRRQSSSLLQRDVAGSGTQQPTLGELLGFLEAASKFGRLLHDEDERDTAQGIMDIRVAAVLNRDATAGSGSRPFLLEDYNAAAAGVIENEIQQLQANADAAALRATDILPPPPEIIGLEKSFVTKVVEFMPTWTQPLLCRLTRRDLDADAQISRALLLKFIRLKEKSLDAYSVPLPAEDNILRDTRAKSLLDKLIAAGVIKQQHTQDGTPPSYIIAHESLISRWPVLADCVRQRRSFRELARGWENGGRHYSALLHSGTQLDGAIDYAHLSDLENAFLEASRRAATQDQAWAFSVAATIIVALIILTAYQFESNKRLDRINLELDAARRNMEHKFAMSTTSVSVIRSINDLLEHGAPNAIELAKLISQTSADSFSELKLPEEGRHNIEVIVGLDSNFLAVDGLIELLKANGYDVLAGTPLPRNVTVAPTQVRSFYESDREDAAKLANLLIPALSQVLPIDEVNRRLGTAGSGKTEVEKRMLITSPSYRHRLIELDPENDPTAPKGFLQIVVDPKALPLASEQ